MKLIDRLLDVVFPNRNKVRINFDINQDKLPELEALMKEMRVDSQREMFDNALTLFRWCLIQAQSGKAVGSLTADGSKFTALQFPAFDHAATSNVKL